MYYTRRGWGKESRQVAALCVLRSRSILFQNLHIELPPPTTSSILVVVVNHGLLLASSTPRPVRGSLSVVLRQLHQELPQCSTPEFQANVRSASSTIRSLEARDEEEHLHCVGCWLW